MEYSLIKKIKFQVSIVKFRISFFVVLWSFGSSAYAETNDLSCETIGYAYDYDSKMFYQSKKAHFWYESIDHCTFEGPNHHALVEWRSFFESEVRDSYSYKVRVTTDCGCSGKRASGVARKFQDAKKDFVRRGFKVEHLKGFYPENREINAGAPSGTVLLQY